MSVHHVNSRYQLRVNSYDRVSSLLVALLIICSLTVAGLLIVYFTRRLIASQVAIPVTPVDAGGGGTGGGGTSGIGRELEPPGIDELPDLFEPRAEDTLRALSLATARTQALIIDEMLDAELDPGHGAGMGDHRRPGSGGGEGGGVGGGTGAGIGPGIGEPRREIRFEPASLRQYAQWLDFFHIELGVLGRDNKVHYAYNLSQDKPSVRVGDPAQDHRLYMNPTNSEFIALDRQLAVKAGIADQGEIILQFFPPETQAILFELERQQAGGRKLEQIRHTVYRVKAVGQRFEFSVESQSYR